MLCLPLLFAGCILHESNNIQKKRPAEPGARFRTLRRLQDYIQHLCSETDGASVLRNLNNCVWLLMYLLCFWERSQFSSQHEDVSAIVILVHNSSVFICGRKCFFTWKQPASSDPTGHVAVFPPTALAGQVSDTHVLKREGVVCGVTFGCVVVCHTYHVVELCLSRVSDRMHGRKQGRKKPLMRARKCSWNQREVFFFFALIERSSRSRRMMFSDVFFFFVNSDGERSGRSCMGVCVFFVWSSWCPSLAHAGWFVRLVGVLLLWYDFGLFYALWVKH